MLFAQPGREFRASHFLDANRQPIMFQIVFVEGEAEVDEQLGAYLIDKGLAAKSPILLPQGAAA